jgi:hypothetical protein
MHERRRKSGLVALAGALLALAAIQLVRGHDPGSSVDFYQFWSVGAARGAEAGLPTPYNDPEATRSVLERIFADETDPRLLRVHRFRMGEYEPFASPLLYLGFSLLPGDYALAVRIHWLVGVLAFGFGALTLLRLAGASKLSALAAIALLALAYRPLGDDLFTGNLGSPQLAVLAAVSWIAMRAIPGATGPARIGWTSAALVLLGGLVLVKATLAPAALFLLLHLAHGAELREFVRALGLALLGWIALLVAPLVWLGSASAWSEWLGLIVGQDAGRLSEYAVAVGNTSTPRLLEEWTGVDPLLAAAGVGVVLSISAAPVARRVLSDAGLAAGMGVVVTLAMAPLVWFHYFVLALVPAIRLIAERGVPRGLGVLALALYSLYQPDLVTFSRDFVSEWLAPLWSLTWVSLWIGLLVAARRSSDHPGPPSRVRVDR